MPRRFEGRAMDIAPIKTKRDYRRMLKEVEGLMSAKRNTPEGDRLDVLVTLVEAWEAKHYPLDLPDPPQYAIHGTERVGAQGSRTLYRSRSLQVLNHKRPLSLRMIDCTRAWAFRLINQDRRLPTRQQDTHEERHPVRRGASVPAGFPRCLRLGLVREGGRETLQRIVPTHGRRRTNCPRYSISSSPPTASLTWSRFWMAHTRAGTGCTTGTCRSCSRSSMMSSVRQPEPSM